MKKNSITVKSLKQGIKSSPAASVSPKSSEGQAMEQQMFPLSFQSTGLAEQNSLPDKGLMPLKGVSITFPDGVIVSVKEISRRDLSEFINLYNIH
jgi:hypothetical protein